MNNQNTNYIIQKKQMMKLYYNNKKKYINIKALYLISNINNNNVKIQKMRLF